MSRNIQRKSNRPPPATTTNGTGHAPSPPRIGYKDISAAADAFLKRRGLVESRRWNERHNRPR